MKKQMTYHSSTVVEEILKNRNFLVYKESNNDYVTKCWSGLHDDSNPSMRVDKDSGVFHCFSCGFSGNLLHEENIILDVRSKKIRDIKNKISKIKINTSVTINNTLNLEDMIPTEIYRNLPVTFLKKYGLFGSIDKDNSLWIVAPIKSSSNKVIGYVKRRFGSDAQPKVKIDPPGLLLTPTPRVKPINNTIILVEGYFDMLSMHYYGYTNTITTMGTSFLNLKNYKKQQENLALLNTYKILGVEKLILLYDGDRAGYSAMINGESFLKQDYIVDIIALPDNEDPNSIDKLKLKKLIDKSLFNMI